MGSAAELAGRVPGERLLIIANRLPITCKRTSDGYELSLSSAGRVTGLAGLAKSRNFIWYGWPGREILEDDRKHFHDRLSKEYSAVPVLLKDSLAENGLASEPGTLVKIPLTV